MVVTTLSRKVSTAQLAAYRERIRDALGRPAREVEHGWWLRKRPELGKRPWDVWTDALTGKAGIGELEHLVEVAGE